MTRSESGKIWGPKNLRSTRRHGMSKTKTYNSWMAMRSRCNNPNNNRFPIYGGRGIKVCDRWNKFENFLADMGEKPLGTSLDRIDVNKGYLPENCRWATFKEQANNQSRKRISDFTYSELVSEINGRHGDISHNSVQSYGQPGGSGSSICVC